MRRVLETRHFRPPGVLTKITLLVVTCLALASFCLAGRRVNVPFFSGGVSQARCAIFWFGQVDNTRNHVNVRLGYTDGELVIFVQVFDRYLWYDTTPSASGLTSWDAVTVFLNLDGNSGASPTDRAYQFVAQLNWWEERASFQTSYRGNGSTWVNFPVTFTTSTAWRGNTLNEGTEARGWAATFRIPFSNLGLSGAPSNGTVWGLAIAVHDRDDAQGTPIADTKWPETLDPIQPDSWGMLHFGMPEFKPDDYQSATSHLVRQGLNGTAVVDAHVGGHSICGDEHGPLFFPTWGSANYSGYDQINIQTQADVADWPCFSRFYVTFPLDSIPVGKVLVSARLRLHAFGNAWGDPPPRDSLIHVFATEADWQESLITWNNAPLAEENISSTWVSTVPSGTPWPGVPYDWDVSRAVAAAYSRDEPARLVLYESDTQYHSGKYFSSSDTGDWNAIARPTLEIVLGEPAGDTPPDPPQNLRLTVPR